MATYITDPKFNPMYRTAQDRVEAAQRRFDTALDDLSKAIERERVNGAKVQKQKRDKAIFGPKRARWK